MCQIKLLNVKDSEHSHQSRRSALTRADARQVIRNGQMSKCGRFDALRLASMRVKARQCVGATPRVRCELGFSQINLDMIVVAKKVDYECKMDT